MTTTPTPDVLEPDDLAKLQSFRTPLAELLTVVNEIRDRPSPMIVPEAALKSLRESANGVRECKQLVWSAQETVASSKADLDRLASQCASDAEMEVAADRVGEAQRSVMIHESRLRASLIAQQKAAGLARQAANQQRAEAHARTRLILAELVRDATAHDGKIGTLLRDINYQRDSMATGAVIAITSPSFINEIVKDLIAAEMEAPL